MHTNEQSQKGKLPAMTTGESDAGGQCVNDSLRWFCDTLWKVSTYREEVSMSSLDSNR